MSGYFFFFPFFFKSSWIRTVPLPSQMYSTTLRLEGNRQHINTTINNAHKGSFTHVHVTQSCKYLTFWNMKLAVSAPDGSFPIGIIVWCCSPSSGVAHRAVVLLQALTTAMLTQDWLYCCFSVSGIVSGPMCRAGGYCALFSGILTQADVYVLVYVTVCQHGDSFTLQDLHIPTVIHLWPQLLCSKVWMCVVKQQTESESPSVIDK